jgi:TolB-like protein
MPASFIREGEGIELRMIVDMFQNRVSSRHRPSRRFAMRHRPVAVHFIGRIRPMRHAVISAVLALCICTFVQGERGAAAAPPAPKAHPDYRLGKAPKAEFRVAGKAYKIDVEAVSTKKVRDLKPEEFDPTTRRRRVEEFYRATFKEHFEESRGFPDRHCGPFRREFIFWVTRWPARLRARWAWHHHLYIEESLWLLWMKDSEFAAELAKMERQNTPVAVGYMPDEYANTSAVFIYNDEYMDAAYNPIPFLAVLTLKSLKPDQQNDWIGTAAADSLANKLSTTPGLVLADREQVAGAVRDQKLPDAQAAEPESAAKIGKALDVEQVVAGSYVVDGDKVLFNLRIVNVQTGAMQNGISKIVSRGHLLEELPALASSLTQALGYQLPEETPAGAVSTPREYLPQQPKADGGNSANAPSPDSGTLAGLSKSLNEIGQWTVNRGSWKASADGKLEGEGDCEMVFNQAIPANSTLTFHFNVLRGMRPRMYFDGAGIYAGNEGKSKNIWVYGHSSSLTGQHVSYTNDQEHVLAIKFSDGHFEMHLDDQLIAGKCDRSDSIHLRLEGGDWWSKGTTAYWGFHVEPAATDAPPAVPAKQ